MRVGILTRIPLLSVLPIFPAQIMTLMRSYLHRSQLLIISSWWALSHPPDVSQRSYQNLSPHSTPRSSFQRDSGSNLFRYFLPFHTNSPLPTDRSIHTILRKFKEMLTKYSTNVAPFCWVARADRLITICLFYQFILSISLKLWEGVSLDCWPVSDLIFSHISALNLLWYLPMTHCIYSRRAIYV